METLICNDTVECIMKTIDFLRKVKHIRLTAEKIYNSIRKELNDKLDVVEYKTNIDYYMKVEVTDTGDQYLVFIVERTEERSDVLSEKTISETNIETEIQMPQKEDGNTKIRLGNVGILYEHFISNLKSEINFSKNKLLAKNFCFKDEITFLCRQLSEALPKKSTLPLISQVVLLQLMLINHL